MSAPVRIQQRRARGWKAPAGAIYVGRPSRWDNPFVVGRDGDAKYCVRLYTMLMGGYLALSAKASVEDQRTAFNYVRRNRWRLAKAKYLMCSCRVDKPCHADVLIDIVQRGSK